MPGTDCASQNSPTSAPVSWRFGPQGPDHAHRAQRGAYSRGSRGTDFRKWRAWLSCRNGNEARSGPGPATKPRPFWLRPSPTRYMPRSSCSSSTASDVAKLSACAGRTSISMRGRSRSASSSSASGATCSLHPSRPVLASETCRCSTSFATRSSSRKPSRLPTGLIWDRHGQKPGSYSPPAPAAQSAAQPGQVLPPHLRQ